MPSTQFLDTTEKTVDTGFGKQRHGDACSEMDDAKCVSRFAVDGAFGGLSARDGLIAVIAPAVAATKNKTVAVDKPSAGASIPMPSMRAVIDRVPANASKTHVTGKHFDPMSQKATACEGFVVDKAAGTVTSFRCPANKSGVCPAKPDKSCVLDTPVPIGR